MIAKPTIEKTDVGCYILKNILEDSIYNIDIEKLSIVEKSKPKKKCQILDKTWVEYVKEKPTTNAYYLTKVGEQEVSDYWSENYFVYNDHLLTHWKRK